jgi:hypothetical protein
MSDSDVGAPASFQEVSGSGFPASTLILADAPPERRAKFPRRRNTLSRTPPLIFSVLRGKPDCDYKRRSISVVKSS